VERYVGWVVYWTVLCYHPYLVPMLFADLLSLHLVTLFFYSCDGFSLITIMKCALLKYFSALVFVKH